MVVCNGQGGVEVWRAGRRGGVCVQGGRLDMLDRSLLFRYDFEASRRRLTETNHAHEEAHN